jgi:hypothetical protein
MFFYKLLNFFTMTEFWDKPAEKSGKVLAAFLEGQPLVDSLLSRCRHDPLGKTEKSVKMRCVSKALEAGVTQGETALQIRGISEDPAALQI